jgi:hypothetical protein
MVMSRWASWGKETDSPRRQYSFAAELTLVPPTKSLQRFQSKSLPELEITGCRVLAAFLRKQGGHVLMPPTCGRVLAEARANAVTIA